MTERIETAAAEAIELRWLLAQIEPTSAFGRSARARESFPVPGDEEALRAAIERVAAVASTLAPERLDALREIVRNMPDPRLALIHASAGGVLADVDLFDLTRFVDALEDLTSLSQGLDGALPIPAPAPRLAELLEVGRTNQRTFYLADAFDTDLAAARVATAVAQESLDLARGRLAERAARFAGVDFLRDGEFAIMRDRLTGPIPAEIRIVREAPTYVLCELAFDDTATAALAERDRCAEVVARVEEDVRRRLSEAIAAEARGLEIACGRLGELDALLGRVRFAQRTAGVVPELVTDPRVELRDARHPPLADRVVASGRAYVPISIAVDSVGVLTGPNMGGKSAVLRTLGFAAACVFYGVPVPAAAARLPIPAGIVWLGIHPNAAAAAEDDGALLSAFGREVAAVARLLARSQAPLLVLADEFARTTAPREGRALLVALVETLRARSHIGLAATHLPGIARAARAPHFAIGGLRRGSEGAVASSADETLATALARIAATMDFRVVATDEDDAPDSGALALAAMLGVDPKLVARAREVLAAPR